MSPDPLANAEAAARLAASARRSWLFVPGDRSDRFAKAEMSGADVAIVDLEDGVSGPNKASARQQVAQWLATPRPDGGAIRAVRVNALDTDDYVADVDALRDAPRPDVIVVPKAESAEDMVTVLTSWWTVDGHNVRLLAGIETVRGVLAAGEILAVEGVDYCYFGAEDYMADLGGVRSEGGIEVLTPKSLVAMHAHVSGVWALDSIVTRINDLDLVERDAVLGKSLGFKGKICIHPSHAGPINTVFSSGGGFSAGAGLEWARKVVAAADEKGSGAFSLDGQMIDAPLIAQARRILGSAG
ncbi:MAG: CoA ester lyase [Acidimicrobiia bacterium]